MQDKSRPGRTVKLVEPGRNMKYQEVQRKGPLEYPCGMAYMEVQIHHLEF